MRVHHGWVAEVERRFTRTFSDLALNLTKPIFSDSGRHKYKFDDVSNFSFKNLPMFHLGVGAISSQVWSNGELDFSKGLAKGPYAPSTFAPWRFLGTH